MYFNKFLHYCMLLFVGQLSLRRRSWQEYHVSVIALIKRNASLFLLLELFNQYPNHCFYQTDTNMEIGKQRAMKPAVQFSMRKICANTNITLRLHTGKEREMSMIIIRKTWGYIDYLIWSDKSVEKKNPFSHKSCDGPSLICFWVFISSKLAICR